MTHGFLLDSCTTDVPKALGLWKTVTHTSNHSQKADLESCSTFLLWRVQLFQFPHRFRFLLGSTRETLLTFPLLGLQKTRSRLQFHIKVTRAKRSSVWTAVGRINISPANKGIRHKGRPQVPWYNFPKGLGQLSWHFEDAAPQWAVATRPDGALRAQQELLAREVIQYWSCAN